MHTDVSYGTSNGIVFKKYIIMYHSDYSDCVQIIYSYILLWEISAYMLFMYYV